jgi:hypothetical protein
VFCATASVAGHDAPLIEERAATRGKAGCQTVVTPNRTMLFAARVSSDILHGWATNLTRVRVRWVSSKAGVCLSAGACHPLTDGSENSLGQHGVHTLYAIHNLRDMQVHGGAREHVGIIPG